MLNWIRQGRWEFTRTHAIAVPQLPPEPTEEGVGAGLRWALDRTSVELAARRFLEEPKGWQNLVGDPGGWVRYQLEPRDRREVLETVQEVAREVAQPVVPAGADGCTADEAEVLRSFLERFGPLGPVRGLVEPFEPMTHERELRAVSLTRMRDDMHLIAGWARFAERRRYEFSEREEFWETTTRYLREVAVRPLPRQGGITYEIQPATLRADLWMELVRTAEVGLNPQCRVCFMKLPRRNGRGRQREYCDVHSGWRYRDQVNKGGLLEVVPENPEKEAERNGRKHQEEGR